LSNAFSAFVLDDLNAGALAQGLIEIAVAAPAKERRRSFLLPVHEPESSAQTEQHFFADGIAVDGAHLLE
jgi:hypothetical protein